MKIGHVIPSIESSSGGPPRSTSATIRAVNAVEPSVENWLISTQVDVTDEWRRSLREYLPSTTTLRLFPSVGSHTLNVSGPLIRWVWNEISEFDLLVVRAMLHPMSTICAWVARVQDVPYVVTPHGTLSRYTFEHRNTLLKRMYFRAVESGSLENAAAIHCTTDQEGEQVAELGTSTPIKVIPHPYERIEYEKNYERDPNLILFLSRLDPMKGIELLLAAFRDVCSAHSDAQLVVAGSGDETYEKKLRKEVRDLGIEDKIDFPGFVEGEQKRRLFKQASIFALPSYRENFGIAAVEAMDAGLPVVITTEVDTYPEVADYEAGIVIKPNTEQLAEALSSLLRNEGRRRKMGKNGESLVESEYAPTLVGEKVLDMYREAAEKT